MQEINVLAGAKLKSAIEQNGEIVVYAYIDRPTSQLQTKKIFVVGTGWPFDDMDKWWMTNFIGTVKVRLLVFHVFEVEDLPF